MFIPNLFSQQKTNNTQSDDPADDGSGVHNGSVNSGSGYSPDYPGFSRGYTNNNPGNVRITSIGWQGKVVPSTDSEYEQFVSLGHGIRASVKNLESYVRKGINRASDMIRYWQTGNVNTGNPNYANHVISKYLSGVDGTIVIGSQQFQNLMLGIFDFENGGHPPGLSEDMIRAIIWNYMSTN